MEHISYPRNPYVDKRYYRFYYTSINANITAKESNNNSVNSNYDAGDRGQTPDEVFQMI